jgi:hypothetical protein
LTTEKIVVLAPMPSANAATAANVNGGSAGTSAANVSGLDRTFPWGASIDRHMDLLVG